MPRLSFLRICLLVALLAVPSLVAQSTGKLKRYTVSGIQPLETGTLSGAEIGMNAGPEVLVSGMNPSGTILTQLYSGGEESFTVDRGDTTFTLSFSLVTQTLEQVWRSSSLWYDFDADGDLDLVLMGARSPEVPFNPVTGLYLNDRGQLSRTNAALPGLYDGAIAIGDLYGDGRIFLLLSGRSADEQPLFNLYRIDVFEAGNGTGTHDAQAIQMAVDIPGFALPALALGDCDADGDQDLALSGLDAVGRPHVRLYRNSGSGFTDVPQSIPGLFNGGLAFADVDGDTDADLVVTGAAYGPATLEGVTALYRSHDCTLTKDPSFNVPPLAGNTALLADHDNDGDHDLLLNGFAGNPQDPRETLHVYLNEGSGAFTLYDEQQGALYSNAAWLDLNGDGFLDPLVAGSRSGAPTVILYRKPGLPTLPPPLN